MRIRPATTVTTVAAAGVFALTASVWVSTLGPALGADGELAAQAKAPTMTVDRLWPRPLPNHWLMGSVTGLAVASGDRIVVAHRRESLNSRTEIGLSTDPVSAEACCLAAPPILEFDASGALLSSWGGPGTGYDWPASTGGIAVTGAGDVWITAAGAPEPTAAAAGATGVVSGGNRGRGAGAGAPAANPTEDAHLLQFTRDGNFLKQIGKPGKTDASDPANLDRPADIAVDDAAKELYVADGGTHQRVAVFDATTGAFKREWKANGAPFERLSSIALSTDGQVYVGDRKTNRVQIFKKDGAFVRETVVAKGTLGNGSVWDIGFSSDPAQQWMFVADGQNARVVIFDRKAQTEVGAIGDGGRWPGRFYAVNNVAMDSQGNVITGEGYEGKRIQKFTKSAAALTALQAPASNDMVMAPKFEVDPAFPKPLGNHWVLGMSVGVAVDEQDHVWMVHRPPTISANEKGADQTPATGTCCFAAPPVLEFDQTGTLLRHWGGPVTGAPYEWPESNHGMWIDHKQRVWIGANSSNDAHIVVFTKDGKFIAQYGHAGKSQGSNDPENFGSPAKIMVDPKANEAYIADGYRNKRVVVIDADTGARKRYWGAYGNKPDDTPLGSYDPAAKPTQQFRGPVHCAMVSKDGFVYVCDRQSDRVQVFKTDGTYVNEVFINTKTRGDGSIWDIAFSADPEQKYMYVADGKNERVYILDRKTLELLSSFGDGGRQPGQWFGAHSIATDSKGNIYTVETYEGRRLQKFVFKGVQMVPRWQGVPWPSGK